MGIVTLRNGEVIENYLAKFKRKDGREIPVFGTVLPNIINGNYYGSLAIIRPQEHLNSGVQEKNQDVRCSDCIIIDKNWKIKFPTDGDPALSTSPIPDLILKRKRNNLAEPSRVISLAEMSLNSRKKFIFNEELLYKGSYITYRIQYIPISGGLAIIYDILD